MARKDSRSSSQPLPHEPVIHLHDLVTFIQPWTCYLFHIGRRATPQGPKQERQGSRESSVSSRRYVAVSTPASIERQMNEAGGHCPLRVCKADANAALHAGIVLQDTSKQTARHSQTLKALRLSFLPYRIQLHRGKSEPRRVFDSAAPVCSVMPTYRKVDRPRLTAGRKPHPQGHRRHHRTNNLRGPRTIGTVTLGQLFVNFLRPSNVTRNARLPAWYSAS